MNKMEIVNNNLVVRKEILVGSCDDVHCMNWNTENCLGCPCSLFGEVEKTIVNLTPHGINLLNRDLTPLVTIPASGNVARCTQETIPNGNIGGIPITATSFGEVEGLPQEKEATYYIVSRLVMQGCPSRRDLLVPNELQRDDEGHIIGCLSLANN